MALYADGPASTIEDLRGFDSQLLDVASTERIDVTRKIALAHEELGVDLAAVMARTASPTTAAEALRGLVTTPALKLWHVYRTLEMVYGDAYNSQLNDRYAGKRDQFRAMAKWAREKLIETGLGISSDPVPRATSPEVTVINGALPDDTYYVTVAWLNASGEEGQCAPPVVISTIQSSFQVRVTGAPATVSGWNLYIGTTPDEVTLQNSQAIAPGQSWSQPSALVAGGRGPAEGQTPASVRPVPRILLRG